MTKDEQKILDSLIVANANGKLTSRDMLNKLLDLLHLREKEGYKGTKGKK